MALLLLLLQEPCARQTDRLVDELHASYLTKGAITSKIKHAIKLKTSPARLAQLLHNCCSPHWHFVLACSQCGNRFKFIACFILLVIAP